MRANSIESLSARVVKRGGEVVKKVVSTSPTVFIMKSPDEDLNVKINTCSSRSGKRKMEKLCENCHLLQQTQKEGRRGQRLEDF